MGSQEKQEKRHNHQNLKVLASVNPNSDNFNFELWARAVRAQMVAALEKRLCSSQPKTAI